MVQEDQACALLVLTAHQGGSPAGSQSSSSRAWLSPGLPPQEVRTRADFGELLAWGTLALLLCTAMDLDQ
jgi:hypothetical protein